MSNDAKLGLVLGVAIVLVIGLVFFRNDAAVARLPMEKGRTTTALTGEPRERHESKAGVGR